MLIAIKDNVHLKLGFGGGGGGGGGGVVVGDVCGVEGDWFGIT